MSYDPVPPFRRDFDAARDPYTARNALGITSLGGGGGGVTSLNGLTGALNLTAGANITITPSGSNIQIAATGSSGAPVGAEYITSSADATLTNERLLTNTATVTWDFSTAGQAKATATIDLSAYAPLASPTFTGDPKAPTPATADNDTSIATTAFVKAQGYITSATASASFQPLDAELTALASTISAADQVPYFTGSGTASTMTVTSAARTVLDDTSTTAMRTTLGAGNVSNTGTPVDNQLAVWTAATTIEGDSQLTWDGSVLLVQRTSGNHLRVSGNAPAGPPFICIDNSSVDTNIGPTFGSKGTGAINFATNFNPGVSSNAQVRIGHTASPTRQLTLTGGTAAQQPLIFASDNSGISLQGTNTNDNAQTGFVGEFSQANKTTSSGSLTSGTIGTYHSTTLSAGDWDVWMHSTVVGPSGGGGGIELELTTGSSLSGNNLAYITTQCAAASASHSVDIQPVRFQLAASTTINLNYRVGITGMSISNAYIAARRRR